MPQIRLHTNSWQCQEETLTATKQLTLNLIETPFNAFACLFAYGNIIREDPTLVDLTSNFFVVCANMKVNLYNYLFID